MSNYLQISDVGMVFETRKGKFPALCDIDLQIDKGEFVTLIGHSGCGKSGAGAPRLSRLRRAAQCNSEYGQFPNCVIVSATLRIA